MGRMLQLAAMAAAFCVLWKHQYKRSAAHVRHALRQEHKTERNTPLADCPDDICCEKRCKLNFSRPPLAPALT
jgi:hypothetical protein